MEFFLYLITYNIRASWGQFPGSVGCLRFWRVLLFSSYKMMIIRWQVIYHMIYHVKFKTTWKKLSDIILVKLLLKRYIENVDSFSPGRLRAEIFFFFFNKKWLMWDKIKKKINFFWRKKKLLKCNCCDIKNFKIIVKN